MPKRNNVSYQTTREIITAKPVKFSVREHIPINILPHQEIVNDQLKDIKKDYGMFFTPEWVVNFMVSLINISGIKSKKEFNILEPACGLCQFLIGIKREQTELFKKSRLFGVEVNQDVSNYLTTLAIDENVNLIKSDYLLWNSNMTFDLIIGNPPYGIPSLSEHYTIRVDNSTKEKYKNIFETWHGKYNVYGAFIEKSIKLLNPNGQMIFIVPPTFMILDEFKKLRHFFSANGRLTIIYMGQEVFKPEADVASVVIVFHKSDKLTHSLKLLEYKENKIYPVKINHNWKGEVVTFETGWTQLLESICSYSLGDIYEIKISPRTPEIKSNPDIIKEKKLNENTYLPILNGKNLKCNKIIYDNLTGYSIKKTKLNEFRGYFGIPHIVIGLGFRENGKVGAALDEKCFPWMGDVYHIFRKCDLFNTGFDLNESEILEYLNSDYIRKYIKDTYRAITYHLSITQLKNIPLPNKNEWLKIKNGKLF